MSQNIYDTAEFFENYSQLDRSQHGLDGAPEWPRIQTLLPPDLTGFRILDLGCGFGWFTRWARDRGAAHVHGIDLSANMLAGARERTAASALGSERISYQRADLEGIQLPEADAGAYDLAYSSLALHYLVDLPALIAQVHRVLKPGARFVFTIEHPIWTAPSRPGRRVDPDTGSQYWPLDEYQAEGLRVTSWLVEGFRKQHRTMTTYVNAFLDAGFEITGFNEWYPNEEEAKLYPGWVVSERIKPTFLLMSVKKK